MIKQLNSSECLLLTFINAFRYVIYKKYELFSQNAQNSILDVTNNLHKFK